MSLWSHPLIEVLFVLSAEEDVVSERGVLHPGLLRHVRHLSPEIGRTLQERHFAFAIRKV